MSSEQTEIIKHGGDTATIGTPPFYFGLFLSIFHKYTLKGEELILMTKPKLNYRFHNPNPIDVTVDNLLKICIEANAEKVKSAIQASQYMSLNNIQKDKKSK